MAKSKYEYVKDFENHEKCIPNCWIMVRIDGKGFHKFAEKHNFVKPNDQRCLKLMTNAAKEVMTNYTDIIIAFGQSDEFSFVLRKDTYLFKRRGFKILTSICSLFTSSFVFYWPKHFETQNLLYPPTFDGRLVLYPSDENIRDYLSWRQADVHINNLYNTCFWHFVLDKNYTNQQAEESLQGTVSSEKNEILFSEFGINYNNEPEEFRKGTTIVRKSHKKSDFEEYTGDIIGNKFWDERPDLLKPKKKKPKGEKTRKNSEKNPSNAQENVKDSKKEEKGDEITEPTSESTENIENTENIEITENNEIIERTENVKN